MSGTEDVSGLCCCEYHTCQGERAHLLQLCCDCEALDSAVDSLVSGRGVKSDTVREILDVVEERVRIPWRGGAVQLPLSAALPVLLVPGLLWLASLHPALAALTFLLLLPALFLVAVRCIVKHKPKTKFFVRWSAVTAAYLLYVYEVKAVGTFWDLPKLISWWENLVLVLAMAAAALSCWKLKMDFARGAAAEVGDTVRMCRVCEVGVAGRDHHCVWLDMCVHRGNLELFAVFLAATALTTGHLALLLTSSACPGRLLGPVLLPAVCWPASDTGRQLLVSGLYSGLICAMLTVLLIGHFCRKCRSL